MKLNDLKEFGIDRIEIKNESADIRTLEISDEFGDVTVSCKQNVIDGNLFDLKLKLVYITSLGINDIKNILIVLGIYKKPLISFPLKENIKSLIKIGLKDIQDDESWWVFAIKAFDSKKYIEVQCSLYKPEGIIDDIGLSMNYAPVNEKQLKKILKIID